MIIGIGRSKRVGKDLAAEGLVRELGFTRIGFADKLKELALAADPLITSGTRTVNTQVGHGRLKWTVYGLGGWETAKDTYAEVRPFLERLGKGARLVFGEDFWVDIAMLEAKRHDNVVLPDVRHLNEAEAIRKAGGKVVRIDRPGFPARGEGGELDDFEFDFRIVNDGTTIDLQRKLVDYVKSLK